MKKPGCQAKIKWHCVHFKEHFKIVPALSEGRSANVITLLVLVLSVHLVPTELNIFEGAEWILQARRPHH